MSFHIIFLLASAGCGVVLAFKHYSFLDSLTSTHVMLGVMIALGASGALLAFLGDKVLADLLFYCCMFVTAYLVVGIRLLIEEEENEQEQDLEQPEPKEEPGDLNARIEALIKKNRE